MRALVWMAVLLAPALALAHGSGGGGGGHGGGGGGHGGGGGGHGGGGGGHGGGGGGHGGGGHGGGGGGHGGGGSSGGSSGGNGWHPSSGIHVTGGASYSGGTSDADDATPCDPNVDVAALNGCRPFGDWALQPDTPHFFIEMGTLMRRMPSTLDGRHGSLLRSAERFHYRMRAGGSDTSVDFVLRLGGEVRPGVYVGAEGEVGGVASFAAADVTVDAGASGVPLFAQRHGFVDGAAAFGGVRERAGRATVSLELAVGVRDIVHAFRMRYDGVTGEQDMGDVRLVVEPRVRVEAWLSPYVTGGVAAGANTIELGDWSAGAFIGLHTRAFDGR